MDLLLNGQALKVVNEFTYLGVVIDRFLSLGPHLKKRIDLVRTRLKQLRRVRLASDKATAIQVYTSMVRSIMEYCSFTTDGEHGSSKLSRMMRSGYASVYRTPEEWTSTPCTTETTPPSSYQRETESSYHISTNYHRTQTT